MAAAASTSEGLMAVYGNLKRPYIDLVSALVRCGSSC